MATTTRYLGLDVHAETITGALAEMDDSVRKLGTIANRLIPERAGDRVKTDRKDAVKLARCYHAWDLTAVWVPHAAPEAVRDLGRASRPHYENRQCPSAARARASGVGVSLSGHPRHRPVPRATAGPAGADCRYRDLGTTPALAALSTPHRTRQTPPRRRHGDCARIARLHLGQRVCGQTAAPRGSSAHPPTRSRRGESE